MIDLIAFDADDTLWHNVPVFSMTHKKFARLLEAYHSAEFVEQRLYDTETRNIQILGYGIKSFTISMIETAIELTEGRIKGSEVQQIIDFSKEMLKAQIELLDHVEEALLALSKSHDLMIITKGDLFDQQAKVARSRLGGYFRRVEVVSQKSEAAYLSILTNCSIRAERFLMAGDSLKSDVLPVVGIGAHAVHIPYHTTWAHEAVPNIDPEQKSRYYELKHIGQLPSLVERLRAPRDGRVRSSA